jgi:hypothetical protein
LCSWPTGGAAWSTPSTAVTRSVYRRGSVATYNNRAVSVLRQAAAEGLLRADAGAGQPPHRAGLALLLAAGRQGRAGEGQRGAENCSQPQIGGCRALAKGVLRYVPVIGWWAVHCHCTTPHPARSSGLSGDVFLSRSYEKDKQIVKSKVCTCSPV